METHLGTIVLKFGKEWAIFMGEVSSKDTQTDTGCLVVAIAHELKPE